MNQMLQLGSIPMTAALCYAFIELLKRLIGADSDSKIKNLYPLISGLFGAALYVLEFLTAPHLILPDSIPSAALTGLLSGLSATGGNQLWKHIKKSPLPPEDNGPARYYITGDKHSRFDRLIAFCKENRLRRKDVIIILGDSGFNYYGDERDHELKSKLNRVGVTLFCLYGNKEKRPETIPTYGIRTFCGGTVYYEPKYPNLFFAKDGEVYNFNGKEFMTIGGAHSVDKRRCLEEGLPYWADEMPSEQIKASVEANLKKRQNRIYGLLTHTCPISCLPTEMFVSTHRATAQNQKMSARKKKAMQKKQFPIDVDRSTERWLELLKEKVAVTEWYCGHYHVDKVLGKVHMMHHDILPFCVPDEEDT